MKEKKPFECKFYKNIFTIELSKQFVSVHEGKKPFEYKFWKNIIESKSPKILRSTDTKKVKYFHLKPEY